MADWIQRSKSRGRRLVRRGWAILFALVCTFGLFMVLPLLQAIGGRDADELMLRAVETATLPPPPPPPPESEQEEEEPPPPPPKLEIQAPPLDLSQLELALQPNLGGDLFGDFAVKLVEEIGKGGGDEAVDEIFSLADLDQRPRALFQRAPRYPPELRRKQRQGTVYVLFIVDTRGRVTQAKVQKSTDPAFEKAALDAVRQWKFEPGTRQGEKVPFRMRVPITFNAG